MFDHRAGDSVRPAFAWAMMMTSLLSKVAITTGGGVLRYLISHEVVSLLFFVGLVGVGVGFSVSFFSVRIFIFTPFAAAFLSSSVRAYSFCGNLCFVVMNVTVFCVVLSMFFSLRMRAFFPGTSMKWFFSVCVFGVGCLVLWR